MIWWGLLGALLIGFAIMDGFDLGVAALLPLVARTDVERRVALNLVGPVWEGNQVWLITAGGAIFAAWPLLYAASFSGFYLAMMLALLALILRPSRLQVPQQARKPALARQLGCRLCFSGTIAALVFGVAMGNVILGVPASLDPDTLRPVYTGHFFQLFSPFALLSGLLSVALVAMHGAVLLAWRTDGMVAARARRWGAMAALLSIALFRAARGILGGLRHPGPCHHKRHRSRSPL